MTNTENRSSFKRWHPYLGEWVIFAPTTAVRPWSGKLVSDNTPEKPDFDPSCYLCPGVKRAGGTLNPDYRDVYVFDNDYPSLTMASNAVNRSVPHSEAVPAKGICRVVCFSPKHNLTLAEMDSDALLVVLKTFREQYRELSAKPEIQNVSIFENKGEIIGVSNPHPHGQIYASDFIPRILSTQYENARNHLEKTGSCIYCDVLSEERKSGERIICENALFTAFVPAFARHSFEVHIMPRRHVASLVELTEDELLSLALIYREMLIRFDNLFGMSFPNITLFRNVPCREGIDISPWHFHIEFCPPLRSRDKLKYMAGFETGGGNIINPSLPKESAELLRSLPADHYRRRQ